MTRAPACPLLLLIMGTACLAACRIPHDAPSPHWRARARIELDRLRTPSQQEGACQSLEQILSRLRPRDQQAFARLVAPALAEKASELPGRCLLLWSKLGAERAQLAGLLERAVQRGQPGRFVALELALARTDAGGHLLAAWAVAWLTGNLLEEVRTTAAAQRRTCPPSARKQAWHRLRSFFQALGLTDISLARQAFQLAQQAVCPGGYSHSMVPGGLGVTSRPTPQTPTSSRSPSASSRATSSGNK